MRVVLCLIALFVSFPSYAGWYDKKCWGELTKRAMLRKYNYDYHWGCSDYTSGSKESISLVTSKGTTEGTTMGLDPGITTGHVSSHLQATSSWGACSLVLNDPVKLDREVFVAANFREIKRDLAQGGGEYLTVVATLSGCSAVGASRFGDVVRNHSLIWATWTPENAPFGEAFDQMIDQDPALRSNCRA